MLSLHNHWKIYLCRYTFQRSFVFFLLKFCCAFSAVNKVVNTCFTQLHHCWQSCCDSFADADFASPHLWLCRYWLICCVIAFHNFPVTNILLQLPFDCVLYQFLLQVGSLFVGRCYCCIACFFVEYFVDGNVG